MFHLLYMKDRTCVHAFTSIKVIQKNYLVFLIFYIILSALLSSNLHIQQTKTFSKSTIETLEKDVKYVQS